MTILCPAKLNLYLAVTGRRADGFHDLVSVVVKLDFGDTLTVEPSGRAGRFELVCDDSTLPIDDTNLVLKAARAFAAAARWTGGVRFALTKRIPVGAGLGGGSSDAAAALRALNQLAGVPLAAPELAAVAATVGSDCPLFLTEGPVVIRGRGEYVTPLDEAAAAALRGRRVLVFKPDFGVPTAWAYAQLAAQPGRYTPPAEAEAAVARWNETALFNGFEAVVGGKFLALPVLLERLRAEFGLAPWMSGSGSACGAFLPEDAPLAAIEAAIRAAWGAAAFVIRPRLM